MQKKYLFNILVFLVFGFGCYAQFIPDSGAIKKKNIIELQHFNYHFFDGTKVKWYWQPALNIGYTRLLSGWDHTIAFTLHEFSRGYRETGRGAREQGHINSRYFINLSTYYQYAFFKSNKVCGWLNAGGSYRKGYEVLHVAYSNWYEEIVETHLFRDVGTTAGLRISYYLPLNLILSGETNFTRFLYIKSKGNPFYTFDKGSPRNQLNFQIKLGYNF